MATASSSDGATRRGPPKVMVVDDDDFQLGLLGEQLRQLGFADITTAANGTQALERMAGRMADYRLMLLDLHMPGMDGFALMERLEKAGFTGSLVIVTGQGDDVLQGASLVARLRSFQLLGTIAKPVEPAALAAIVARLSP